LLVTWKYRPRDTFYQRLDPRSRLIFMACVIMALTLGNIWDIRLILPVSLTVLLLYLSARIEWQDIRRAWTFVFILVIVIVGINAMLSGRGGPMEVLREQSPVLYQSPTWVVPLVGWPIRITITTVKTWFAITQIVRMLTMAALAIPIPYTFDPSMYGITFRKLRLPDKASFSMDLAFRFMPTLGRDFNITIDAQRARGYEMEGAQGRVFYRIRKMAPLIIPVTMQAIVTGEEVVDAMDLRAFGVGPRTWLKDLDLQYQRRDYFLIGLGVLIMLTAFALSLLGYGGFWVPEAFLQLGH